MQSLCTPSFQGHKPRVFLSPHPHATPNPSACPFRAFPETSLRLPGALPLPFFCPGQLPGGLHRPPHCPQLASTLIALHSLCKKPPCSCAINLWVSQVLPSPSWGCSRYFTNINSYHPHSTPTDRDTHYQTPPHTHSHFTHEETAVKTQSGACPRSDW